MTGRVIRVNRKRPAQSPNILPYVPYFEQQPFVEHPLMPLDPDGPPEYCTCTDRSFGFSSNPLFSKCQEFKGLWTHAGCGWPTYWGWNAWKGVHRSQQRKIKVRRKRP